MSNFRYFTLRVKLALVLLRDKILYFFTRKDKYNNKDRFIY